MGNGGRYHNLVCGHITRIFHGRILQVLEKFFFQGQWNLMVKGAHLCAQHISLKLKKAGSVQLIFDLCLVILHPV